MTRSKTSSRKRKSKKKKDIFGNSQNIDSQPSQPKKKKIPIKREILRSIPEISFQDQADILLKINAVFEDKVGDLHLAHIMNGIKNRNPDMNLSWYEQMFMKAVKETEKYKGVDPEDMLLSLKDENKIQDHKTLKKFVMFGARMTVQHANENNVALILADGGEDNEQWMGQNILSERSVVDLPLCCFLGVSELLAEHVHFDRVNIMAFNKSEDSPFKELIKYIIDKTPHEKKESDGENLKVPVDVDGVSVLSNGEQGEKEVIEINEKHGGKEAIETNGRSGVENISEPIWEEEIEIMQTNWEFEEVS